MPDGKLISANALIDDLLNKSFYPVIVICSLNYYSDGGMKIVNWDDYCHLGRRK